MMIIQLVFSDVSGGTFFFGQSMLGDLPEKKSGIYMYIYIYFCGKL